MTLSLTTSINATVERMTVTGTVAASVVPGNYRFRLSSSDEIMDLIAFAPVNPERPWPVDRNRWVIQRHVIGTTATTHTNGATVQAIVDEFVVSLNETAPDPLDPNNPGETPTLAEVLAQGNDTGGTSIIHDEAGDISSLLLDVSGDIIRIDTTTGAGTVAAHADIVAISLNADASAVITAQVGDGNPDVGDGNADASRGAIVGNDGNATASTDVQVLGDGNATATPSANITGSGTADVSPTAIVGVDGNALADIIVSVGNDGQASANVQATVTGDGGAGASRNAYVAGAGDAFVDSYATATDGSASAIASATAGGTGNATAVASATAAGGSASIGPIATATTAEIQVNGLPLYTTAAAGPPGTFASLFYVDSTAVSGGTWLWDFVTAAYVRIAGVF